MYIDRWDEGNEHFDSANFRKLCQRLSAYETQASERLMNRPKLYVMEGLASTDEPPRQS